MFMKMLTHFHKFLNTFGVGTFEKGVENSSYKCLYVGVRLREREHQTARQLPSPMGTKL